MSTRGCPPYGASFSRSALSSALPWFAGASAPVADASSTTLCSSCQVAPARRERVHLRGRMMLDQEHAEQDQIGHLHVEHVRIERVRAQLLDQPQRLRVDLAREGEARRGQLRQRPEQLDVAVAEFLQIVGQIVARHARLTPP